MKHFGVSARFSERIKLLEVRIFGENAAIEMIVARTLRYDRQMLGEERRDGIILIAAGARYVKFPGRETK